MIPLKSSGLRWRWDSLFVIIGLVMRNRGGKGQPVQTPQQPQVHQPVQQPQPTQPPQQTQNNNFEQKQTCPFCNAQVPIQFKFCNMCGKQIKN